MSINDSIRELREKNDWTQEQLADRIGMSKNGYAKLERGESQITFERLKQIANAFELDIVDLVKLSEKSFICQISENHSTNYYVSHANHDDSSLLLAEIERLKLINLHKDEIIQLKEQALAQKVQENDTLKQLIEMLKTHK